MQHTPSTNIRYLLSAIILLCALAALYPLTIRLVSQLHFSDARQEIAEMQFEKAIDELQKALRLQPDDFELHYELGNIHYRLAEGQQHDEAALRLLGLARGHFQQALRLHPLDARSAYGLARTEIRLEKLTYLSGKAIPLAKDSPAMGALEQAIALRPASIIYRLAYARYLYLHFETEKLLAEMSNLGRLQPSIHGALRAEPFWSPETREQFFAGVREALAQGVTPRQSLLAASELMAEDNNWGEALRFRQQGMAVQSSLNTTGDFIRLGYLQLMADEPDEALDAFFQALAGSSDIERDIITILQTCRNAGRPDTMLVFYDRTGELYGNSSRIDIAAARNLFDLKLYDQAATVLNRSNTRQKSGEAYYWLSRIAEAEEDWDGFELAIQKATLHDPRNGGYHLRFSQVLDRLQKYERAEKEAGLAIDYSPASNIGLYQYRAGLRMRLQDYDGGLADRLKVLELAPDNAAYSYNVGDALEKMARIDEAAEYFRRAIELEPGNKTYQQRLESLLQKYGEKE